MRKIFFFIFVFLSFPFVVQAYFGADFATVDDETIWMGWTVYESGNINQEGSGYQNVTNSKAYGRYQFHIDFELPYIFMQKMIDYDGDAYSGFVPFLDKDYAKSHTLELKQLWLQYSSFNEEVFNSTQDTIAYQNVYLPTKTALEEKGIHLDEFGPVIKGTVWSVAIRNGVLDNRAVNSKTYQALVPTYHDGISDLDYLNNIMAYQESAWPREVSRWGTGQKTSAVNAMNIEDSAVETNGTSHDKIIGMGSTRDPYSDPFSKFTIQIENGGCNRTFLNDDGSLNSFGMFLHDLFWAIQVLTPVLVIALSTVDYFKALVNGKNVNQKIFKRFIIGFLIFLLPSLLQLLFHIFGMYDISDCGIV